MIIEIKQSLGKQLLENKMSIHVKKELELVALLNLWMDNYKEYVHHTLSMQHIPDMLYLYDNEILRAEQVNTVDFKFVHNLSNFAFSANASSQAINTPQSRYEKTEQLYKALQQNNMTFSEALSHYDTELGLRNWQKQNEVLIKVQALPQKYTLEHQFIWVIELHADIS